MVWAHSARDDIARDLLAISYCGQPHLPDWSQRVPVTKASKCTQSIGSGADTSLEVVV